MKTSHFISRMSGCNRAAAKAVFGLLLLLTPALLHAQTTNTSAFGQKISTGTGAQPAAAVQINPTKESFAGEWETPRRREVIVLNADGTGKETAFGQTGDCTWKLLAGGKMRINESFTEYMLSADGNALLRCSDGKKWTRAGATSEPVPAATGEGSLQSSPFSDTRWRSEIWTYQFKGDGTWTELCAGEPHLSGTWASLSKNTMRTSSGSGGFDFEISDDRQTLYRSDGCRWNRLDEQGNFTRPVRQIPPKEHVFAGTRWKRIDASARKSVYEFSDDGKLTEFYNGRILHARWVSISETEVEQSTPFGRHYRFTLSTDKKTITRADLGTIPGGEWMRMEDGDNDSGTPEYSPKSEFDSFYFDNSTWGSGMYQVELRADGTARFTYYSGQDSFARWQQISADTVLVNSIKLKLGADKMSVERTIPGSTQILVMARVGALPLRDTATVKEYKALLEKYGETVRTALAQRSLSENNRITTLQSAAARRGDATLAGKIKKVADESGDAKFISDDNIDKSASTDEAELLKFVQTRNAAVYDAKKSALQRYRSEFEKILRQTIKTGEHDAGKMIENFLSTELVDENFFIGKWKNGKGVSYEFKRNKTCKRYTAGGDKVTYDSGRGGKRSYTTSTREEDVGEWSFNHVKKELSFSEKTVTLLYLSDNRSSFFT